MIEKYVYTGPSWAASSFPIETDKPTTNLAKEWKIPCIDSSQGNSSALDRFNRVKDIQSLPIVWVYNEPILELTKITNMSTQEFLQRSDWQDIWHECNQHCLSAIASLGVPILLIGGHSDIINCNYSNITIACDSWQKWLAKQAGMPVINGVVSVESSDGNNVTINRAWGAEIMQKELHNHYKINPDPGLVNSVWDILFFWKELEKTELFHDVHPSFQGNQLFAKFLKPIVENFLQENQ